VSNDFPAWSIRSVLVSVSDLDQSATFYQDLMNVHEVLREDQIAVLTGGETGTLTLFLRQTRRTASHPGQQALGVRALAFAVGSPAELDRVEERLRALDTFRDRQRLLEHEGVEVVRGRDPDRLPLTFVGNETGGSMSVDDYRQVLTWMYAMDL
jgi:catechol 2,3-dioxygenase-like lactoylglutathione lyase family enzyme